MVSPKDVIEQVDDNRMILGFDVGELASCEGLSTAEEIVQQPEVWRVAQANIDAARDSIDAWLAPKLMLPGVQVLFAGAGTSAFIGDTVAAWLRSKNKRSNQIAFESVSTTDLVSDPAQYLGNDRPTIMVSFARSGDSPESVAAINLADQLLSECHHLILTCNPDGQVAAYANNNPGVLCQQMPEGTNDRGFAMTSSYSSMLASCVAIFEPDSRQLDKAAQLTEFVISDKVPEISRLASSEFDRLVVVGSGALAGTASEISLKCLELAGGQLVAISDTSLGLRHGPKIVITPSTVVIQLVSNNSYTGRYDRDLLAELKSDGLATKVIEVSANSLFPGENVDLDDIWMSLVFVVYGQIFAFLKSHSLGVTIDSPCPSGEVNRVVQGVTIHPYK